MGTFLTATNKTAKPHDLEKRAPYVLSNVINFGDGGQFPTKPVQTNVIQAVAIPGRTMIMRAWIDVETANPGAADNDLGIAGFADHLLDGANFTTTGRKSAAGTNGGRTLILDSAATVNIVLNSSATYNTLKAKVSVLCVDME